MRTSAEASAGAPSPNARVPEFFIVGNPKSGTTALYEMLKPHSQIYMPDLGTQFFALEQKRYPDTLEDYLAMFEAARPDQRVGEVSRGYLRSPVAASGIAEVQPDARIIAILREPASFVRSLHLELLQDHVETESDLAKAIALEEAQRQDNSFTRPGPGYSTERVAYVEQLRRYHAVFPRERVLVLIYDDFRRDNEATLRTMLRFLEVDDTAALEVKDANPTVHVRSPRLHGYVRSLYRGEGAAGGALKTAVKAVTTQRMRRGGLRTLRQRVLYSKPPPVDEELMLELRHRFKGEVVALSEYLDRDLVTLWGYDGID